MADVAAALVVGMAVVWSARLAAIMARRVAMIPAGLLGISGRHEADAETRASVRRGLLPGVTARCRRCWWRAGRHADHVIPAAWGGPGVDWNLRPLCPRCNTRRGASLTIPELLVLLVPGPADWPVFVVAAAWWTAHAAGLA